MKRIALALAAAFALTVAPTASATLMTLNATSQAAFASNFSITFDDTGDGLLELAEITSFSGVTCFKCIGGTLDAFLGTVVNVPAIPGFASGTGDWAFTNGDVTLHAGYTFWTYQLAAAVPEPATLALLGIGLAGLGFARRRKQ